MLVLLRSWFYVVSGTLEHLENGAQSLVHHLRQFHVTLSTLWRFRHQNYWIRLRWRWLFWSMDLPNVEPITLRYFEVMGCGSVAQKLRKKESHYLAGLQFNKLACMRDWASSARAHFVVAAEHHSLFSFSSLRGIQVCRCWRLNVQTVISERG